MRISERKTAKAAGLVRYFTGKPCPQGHIAEREVINGSCTVCQAERRSTSKFKARKKAWSATYLARPEIKARRKARYQENPALHRQRAAAYYWNDPVRRRDANKARYKANPEKFKTQSRAYRKAHPEWQRNANLRRYGIQLCTYNNMLASQGGACAICKREPGKKPLSVDHEHGSGILRGLLCSNCNSVLGHAKDNLETLYSAIHYLKLHQ